MKKIIIILALLILACSIFAYQYMNNTVSNDETVTKVEKVYSKLEQATNKWMEEEGCSKDIQICFDNISVELITI